MKCSHFWLQVGLFDFDFKAGIKAELKEQEKTEGM